MGAGFTYTGRLLSGGNPADGIYDFEFKLYDDATASTQIGSTVTQNNFTVSGGLFIVALNEFDEFGSNAFTGYERWLEISVKADADISYAILKPRQKINPVPYATFAAHHLPQNDRCKAGHASRQHTG